MPEERTGRPYVVTVMVHATHGDLIKSKVGVIVDAKYPEDVAGALAKERALKYLKDGGMSPSYIESLQPEQGFKLLVM